MAEKIKNPENLAKNAPVVIRDEKRPLIEKTAAWMINNSGGLIQNNVQAGYVLSFFAIIIIVLSIYIFLNNSAPESSLPPQGSFPIYTDQITPPKFFCPQ